jgi:hypothetical protein
LSRVPKVKNAVLVCLYSAAIFTWSTENGAQGMILNTRLDEVKDIHPSIPLKLHIHSSFVRAKVG